MSLLIITLSFLPVFTLEDQEGRLFRPLALTKTFAMAAAAPLPVTLLPALMGWFVKGKIPAEAENPPHPWAIQLHRPGPPWARRRPPPGRRGPPGALPRAAPPAAG